MTDYTVQKQKDIKRGEFIILYGIAGAGKTTLLANIPNALHIQTQECGYREHGEIDVLPPTKDFNDLIGQLRFAYKTCTAQDSKYTSLCIDTASSIDAMIINDVLTNIKPSNGREPQGLEDYGWNSGYELVLKRWMKVVSIIKKFADAGINVFMSCHQSITAIKEPDGTTFGQYNLNITHRKDVSSQELLINNAEAVLFLKTDFITAKKKVGTTTKDVAASNDIQPDRVMFCESKNGLVAKNRHGLEEKYIINKDLSEWKKILKKILKSS